jgi:phytanoyl-CoA hydroxylase
MLSPQQIEQFHRDGYLRSGRVVSDEQVEILRDELARVIADGDNAAVKQPVLLRNLSDNANAPVWQIVNIWEASPPFKELLISNRSIADEMAQLTGASQLRIWHDQIQYKPPLVGGTTGWHQDAPLWPIIQPMTEVSAWVALDDVDEQNGCMRMVPGSHTWGNNIDWIRKNAARWEAMPSQFGEHAIEIRACPVRKGEVHYHHALTWHGSPDNKSERPRRAIAIHFMTQDTRYVSAGNHPMKDFVEVGDGEVMRGEHFPLVWERS